MKITVFCCYVVTLLLLTDAVPKPPVLVNSEEFQCPKRPAPKAYGKTAQLISLVNKMKHKGQVRGVDSEDEGIAFKRQYSTDKLNAWMQNIVGILQKADEPVSGEHDKKMQDLSVRYHMIANPEVLQEYKEEKQRAARNNGDADQIPAFPESDSETKTDTPKHRYKRARVVSEDLRYNNKHVAKRNFDNNYNVDNDRSEFNLDGNIELNREAGDARSWENGDKEDLNPENAWANIKEKDEFQIHDSTLEAKERALDDDIDKNNAKFDQDDENLDIREKLFKDHDVDTMWKKEVEIADLITQKEYDKDYIGKPDEVDMSKKLSVWEHETSKLDKDKDFDIGPKKHIRYSEERYENERYTLKVKTTQKERDWRQSAGPKTTRDEGPRITRQPYYDDKKTKQRYTVKRYTDKKYNSWERKREEYYKNERDRDENKHENFEKVKKNNSWEKKREEYYKNDNNDHRSYERDRERENNKNEYSKDKYNSAKIQADRYHIEDSRNKKYGDRNSKENHRELSQERGWNNKNDNWNENTDKTGYKNGNWDKTGNIRDQKDDERNKNRDSNKKMGDYEKIYIEWDKNTDRSNKYDNYDKNDSYKNNDNKWDDKRYDENRPKENYWDSPNRPKDIENNRDSRNAFKQVVPLNNNRDINYDMNIKDVAHDNLNNNRKDEENDKRKNADKNNKPIKDINKEQKDNGNKKPPNNDKNQKVENNKNKKDIPDGNKKTTRDLNTKNKNNKFDNKNKDIKLDSLKVDGPNNKSKSVDSDKNSQLQGWDYWEEKRKKEGWDKHDDKDDRHHEKIDETPKNPRDFDRENTNDNKEVIIIETPEEKQPPAKNWDKENKSNKRIEDKVVETSKKKPIRNGKDRKLERVTVPLKKYSDERKPDSDDERNNYKKPKIGREWSDEHYYAPKRNKGHSNIGRGGSAFGTPIPYVGKKGIYEE